MTAEFLMDVLIHCALGLMFTGTFACIRGVCQHVQHRIPMKVKLAAYAMAILIESAFTVWLVG